MKYEEINLHAKLPPIITHMFDSYCRKEATRKTSNKAKRTKKGPARPRKPGKAAPMTTGPVQVDLTEEDLAACCTLVNIKYGSKIYNL